MMSFDRVGGFPESIALSGFVMIAGSFYWEFGRLHGKCEHLHGESFLKWCALPDCFHRLSKTSSSNQHGVPPI